jgi:membrane protein YdbS with pleckstrin-like domain
MHPVDPRAVSLWRLQGLAQVATFWVPVATVAGFGLGIKVSAAAGALAAVALLAINLGLALAMPPLRYARLRYGVREHDLLVEGGVFFRYSVSVPLDRIQHVDTRQGPLERFVGLAHLAVYTAAGLSADGSIPGLPIETANELRDRLAHARGGDGV